MSDLLASIPPGTQPPVNVVTRKVFINGTELSNSVLLSQVTVQKSFNKIAFAKMVFLDGSAAARDFPLSNDNKFRFYRSAKAGYQTEFRLSPCSILKVFQSKKMYTGKVSACLATRVLMQSTNLHGHAPLRSSLHLTEPV